MALHEIIVASAARFPDQMAVVDPERDVRVTYGALHKVSTSVQRLLEEAGVGPGSRVGICAPKSIGTVAGIVGVLKAGAAYVPVDSTAPPSRNGYIFADCSVDAIVADDKLLAGLNDELGLMEVRPIEALSPLGVDLVVARPPADRRADRSIVAPANLAYILYTSGSTGKPKGVMHTHTSALSFVDWCSKIFAPTPSDNFSSHAPFHFDLSILDLYVAFKHGATLTLIGESMGQQPARLAETIAEQAISCWYSTPSILRLLLEFGKLDTRDFSALRVINFAGEVFPVKHLRALKSVWPGPRYFNLYGPTETNVCTYFEVPEAIPEERTEPLPIGYPCSGDRCKVMDGDNEEVAPGEEGELYVAGGSVMAGYWNLPERNAEAFYNDETGTRWYKTGDMVRNVDGCYQYLGRRDRMVKRRGYRVELGEIESALYTHSAITEAAVIAMPDEESGVRIIAFMNWTEDASPSIVQLKQFCAKVLPKYMIPDKFSVQPSLPRTSTDKIDLQRLKDLEA